MENLHVKNEMWIQEKNVSYDFISFFILSILITNIPLI